MRVLFLSTWLPYPLTQGSKIRAYYLLRGLAQRHEVALVSFSDREPQADWLAHLQSFCVRVEVVQQDPFQTNALRRARGWFSWKPSAAITTYSAAMAQRVARVAANWQPERVLALTFVMAPYALSLADTPRILDIDNLLGQMLREARQATHGKIRRLRSWLAWKKFEQYEKPLYSGFDRCLVVSERDRQAVSAKLPGYAGRVSLAPNGVDIERNQFCTAPPTPDTLVFNGALTYQANFDAMAYFLAEIFPLIRTRVPVARLRITGSVTDVPLQNLRLDDHVTCTGFLEDVRPTVSESWACVVPLRVGGGTRLKVLEAMALGVPVISTSKGMEGLETVDGEHFLVADTAEAFAAQTVRLLGDPALRARLVRNSRRLVEEHFNWLTIGRDVCQIIEQTTRYGRKAL
jgi:polysaccharide biosynthesis protein PslH